MFSKLTTRFCLMAGASLIVAAGAVTVFGPAASASTGGRSCEMKSAKNTSVFPAGTEFSIKQPFRTVTYTCDGSIGQWWETIYQSPFPGQVVGGNSGVFSNGDEAAPSGPTNTGGGVLQ